MPMKRTKRSRFIAERVDRNKDYVPEEALLVLKELAQRTRFTERIEVAVRLGVDVRQSDQVVRGAFVLPHGTGQFVKVAVFATGEAAKSAKDAGAERVGSDDLTEEIKKGNYNYQVIIATPDMMAMVGKLGPILGPRSLMPNPKLGTVTKDTRKAVERAKSGQIYYRTEKAGIVHSVIGNETFSVKHLVKNLESFIAELKRVKPSASKGIYLRKVSLSSTMGPGLAIHLTSFS